MDSIDWPWFSDSHRELSRTLGQWIVQHPELRHPDEADPDNSSRSIVRLLGQAGWLRFAVPAEFGGRSDRLDVRSLCILREKLAFESGLADFAFAMQGLGAGPISLFGSAALRKKYLPRVASGEAIAAFAISEAEAGSDVAGMRTTARRDGDEYVIDGEKTWISNGGIADFHVVFCRTGDSGYIALVVEPGDPGFSVSARIPTIAPHPLGTLSFDGCRIPVDRVVGDPEKGLRVALGTLDVFRTTVGAAALGFARRAMMEALNHSTRRE